MRAASSLQRLVATAVKIIAQQQVFRRITAQREFGRHQQVRGLRARALGKIQYARGIAGKIADRAVDLGNRDFHPANISSGHLFVPGAHSNFP